MDTIAATASSNTVLPVDLEWMRQHVQCAREQREAFVRACADHCILHAILAPWQPLQGHYNKAAYYSEMAFSVARAG